MKDRLFGISQLLILMPFLLVVGCDRASSPLEVGSATQEQQFVWNALNSWYFWEAQVPDLDANRYSNSKELFDFIGSYRDERQLFESLLYREEDDFSFFIDDYVVHEQARRGQSVSYGFSFGLVRPDPASQELFGYVQYTYHPIAADTGLNRGDIFTRVNGTQLTTNNFRNLLSQNSITLGLAEVESMSPFSIRNLNESISITAREIQENPVYLTRILETDFGKIGYLAYNAFRFNYHEELNDAFGEFVSAGIDHLILDLRYNGGGTVITSALLGSLISGLGEEDIYAQLIYNEKQADNNEVFRFLSEMPVWNREGEFVGSFANMNRLNLNHLYLLTSNRTASASEGLINGLAPFIDVILVGQQTLGKDEGSITLYDSPPGFTNRQNASPRHRRAMQPIVFKIFNSRLDDYPDGFTPVREVREIDFLDNLPPLGDPDEPLLAAALELITGTAPAEPAIAAIKMARQFRGELVYESGDWNPLERQVYLLPEEVPPNSVPVRFK